MTRSFRPTEQDPPLQSILLRWPSNREEGGAHAWRMFCGCILLNASNRVTVDRVWPELFRRWPTPEACLREDVWGVPWAMDLLKPTGLNRRKATLMRQLSRAWPDAYESWRQEPRHPIRVTALPGLGDYARESFEVFYMGRDPDGLQDAVVAAWSGHRVVAGWGDRNLTIEDDLVERALAAHLDGYEYDPKEVRE